jgi:hypothetical protein
MAQSEARKWFDPLLNVVLLSPALWAILHYICGFPHVQAVGLGILLAAIITRSIYQRSANESASKSFRPHMFTIYPQVGRMLIDIGLLTEEELKTITEDVPPYRPWSDKHLLHYGFDAYLISIDPDVVHFPAFDRYATRLDVLLNVDIGFEIEPSKRATIYKNLPGFFIEPSIQCYALGIELPMKWWEKNKDKALPGAVLRENYNHMCGLVRLTLARLSFEVAREFYSDCSAQYRERVKATVAEQGWTNKPREVEGVGHHGEAYTHNYAAVWINALPNELVE